MVYWFQWAYVVLIVVTYAATLGGLLLWERVRTLVVGYGKHRRGANDEPVFLPYFVAMWAAGTMCALAGARDYLEVDAHTSAAPNNGPVPPAPYVVKIPGALGSSAHAFFSTGWHTGLAVFGITVDTWEMYTVVCVYQLTRAVLGSMVNNIFTPFYADTVNSKIRPARKTIKNSLVGLGLVRVFMWWSTITDILISASQLDLALFTLVATVAADVGYGFMRITDIECVSEGACVPTVIAVDAKTPNSCAAQSAQPKSHHHQPAQQSQPQQVQVLMGGTMSTRRRSRSPAAKSYAVQFVMGGGNGVTTYG